MCDQSFGTGCGGLSAAADWGELAARPLDREQLAGFAEMVLELDAGPFADIGCGCPVGPGHGENPLGVEFDPADWLARLRGGTPETEFIVREIHQPVAELRLAAPSDS
jgi:hypothetical protein